MNDWTIISRSMSARMFSTVTTAATVGVAVGLLLTLLTMAESGRQAFRRGSGNMHLLITADSSPLVGVLNSIFYAGIPKGFFLESKLREFDRYASKEVPPETTPGYVIPTQIGDSYRGVPVMATTAEFFTRFQPAAGQPWVLSEGRYFDKDLEIVVGSQAAISANLRVGSKIVLTHGSSDSRGGHAGHVHDEFTFEVVGVLAATGSAHDRAIFTTIQSSWLMHAFDRLELEGKITHGKAGEVPIKPEDLLPGDKKITGMYVRLPTRMGSDVPATLPRELAMLRRDRDIQVSAPGDEIQKLFSIVGVLDKVLIGMAGVVLIGSAISITLALYNSMEQRKRQIAILRVLGCSQGRIFGLVMTEAALLGLMGAVAGVLLAFLGGTVVSEVMFRSYGVQISPGMPGDVVAAVVLGAVLLAALAGLVPAVLAYRTPVANNLKPIG